jgi:hypothetical protein
MGTIDPSPRSPNSLGELGLSDDAIDLCLEAGIETVEELRVFGVETLREHAQCTEDIVREVGDVLDRYAKDSTDGKQVADPRRIVDLVSDRRARKAFQALGIETVGDFFATPKASLLAVAGFGTRTYQRVLDIVRERPAARDLSGMPDRLLGMPLRALDLEPEDYIAVTAFGDETVGEALERSPDAWADERTLDAIAGGLDDLLETLGIADHSDPASERHGFQITPIHHLDEILDSWLPSLHSFDQQLVRWRLGLGCRPTSNAALALRWNIREAELAEREESLRKSLLIQAGEPLLEMRNEIVRDLNAFDGLISGMHLAGHTSARKFGRRAGDEILPLRLLAFVFPDSFFLFDDQLGDTSPAFLNRVTRRAELILRGGGVRLPYPLERLADGIENDLGAVGRPILELAIRKRLGLAIDWHPDKGELVVRPKRDLAERLETILRERGAPTTLDDIVFLHRDRYRSTRRTLLSDTLRGDSRFVELGPNTWGLRAAHIDEFEFLRAEADAVGELIRTQGRQHNIHAAYADKLSERGVYMLIELLREDPGLRDLGRGVFCPRLRRRSSLVTELVRQLKRAMGEVPMSRFVQNQPPANRRMTIRLLERNRLFVSPGPDRIDLIENYPFNPERLRRLMNTIDVCIEAHGRGYAPLPEILEAVQETELAGSFLTEHMLLDLLQRHGTSSYEFLTCPEDSPTIVARLEIGLSAWIQKRVRTALRECPDPLTPQQVLAERPDLAEFADALPNLMEADPMLRTEDGFEFRVV